MIFCHVLCPNNHVCFACLFIFCQLKSQPYRWNLLFCGYGQSWNLKKIFSRIFGNVLTVCNPRLGMMKNYIFYHGPSSLTLWVSSSSRDWPVQWIFISSWNKQKENLQFVAAIWSIVSFSVPIKLSSILHDGEWPTNRLTETARLLVRTNVRRVFGTGGTSRSHSAEKREMELKREYTKSPGDSTPSKMIL